MDTSEIDTYLQALDEELADRTIRKPVRLAVVGGVYMLFFLKIERPRKMLMWCHWIFPIPRVQTERRKPFDRQSMPSLKDIGSDENG